MLAFHSKQKILFLLLLDEVIAFVLKQHRYTVRYSSYVQLRDPGLIRSQARDIIWTRCFPVDTSTHVSDRSLVAHLARPGYRTKLTQVFRFNNLWPSCRSFHDPELTHEVSSISYVQKQRQQDFPALDQCTNLIYIYRHKIFPSLFSSYPYK